MCMSAEVKGREWKRKLKNPGLPNRNFSWSFIPVCNYSFSVWPCYVMLVCYPMP